MQQIFLALEIDTPRALFAIGHLGDWQLYYDPDIVVVSDLIRHLPETLAAARANCERVPISDRGIKVIAGHVSTMIAGHDRRVSEHRDALEFDIDIRRTG